MDTRRRRLRQKRDPEMGLPRHLPACTDHLTHPWDLWDRPLDLGGRTCLPFITWLTCHRPIRRQLLLDFQATTMPSTVPWKIRRGRAKVARPPEDPTPPYLLPKTARMPEPTATPQCDLSFHTKHYIIITTILDSTHSWA